jgi:hypothetical protein
VASGPPPAGLETAAVGASAEDEEPEGAATGAESSDPLKATDDWTAAVNIRQQLGL